MDLLSINSVSILKIQVQVLRFLLFLFPCVIACVSSISQNKESVEHFWIPDCGTVWSVTFPSSERNSGERRGKSPKWWVKLEEGDPQAGLKTKNWFLGLFGVRSVCLRVKKSVSNWKGWLCARLRVRSTLSWCKLVSECKWREGTRHRCWRN